MAVLDFIGSGNSGDQGRDSLKRLWNKGADACMGDGYGFDDEVLHNPHPYDLLLQIPPHPSLPHPLLLAHLLSPNPNRERGKVDTPYPLHSRSTWSSTHSTENKMRKMDEVKMLICKYTAG